MNTRRCQSPIIGQWLLEEEAPAFSKDVQIMGHLDLMPVAFAARLCELIPISGKFINFSNTDWSVFMLRVLTENNLPEPCMCAMAKLK